MKLTRRHAILGLTAVGSGAFLSKVPATVSRPATAFGTTVRLTVAAASEAQAKTCIDAGYAEIRAIERAFSLFDTDSELSILNRTGILRQPSSVMNELVSRCHQHWQITQGAFDPTVQVLWRKSRDEADALRHLVGWQHVHTEHGIAFARNGMGLTFNGIAQGFAADRVLKVVRDHGGLSAVIDTGELAVRSDDAHRFSIQHPRKPDEVIGSIAITDGFIATSGDYATSFSADFSEHHIIDPDTGHSPQELASATVIAPTGATADALATAFMVMGRERALDFARDADGVEAVLVEKSGDIFATDGAGFQKT